MSASESNEDDADHQTSEGMSFLDDTILFTYRMIFIMIKKSIRYHPGIFSFLYYLPRNQWF